MYFDYKKDEQITLQTSGKEKPENKKEPKITQINIKPVLGKKRHSKRSYKQKLRFETTKVRRQSFRVRSSHR